MESGTQQSTEPEQLDGSAEGTEDQITVELTEPVISAEVLEAAKGQEVDLVLDMGEYQWTISGEEITGTELQSVDMTVELDTKNIPQETVSSMAGELPTLQLSLAHSGEFGFAAELTVPVGESYAGQTGSLYYYNEDHALEFVDSGVASGDGRIALEFTHASDYVIVIGDKASSPSDNRWWVIPVTVCVTAGVVVGIVCLKRKSRREKNG